MEIKINAELADFKHDLGRKINTENLDDYLINYVKIEQFEMIKKQVGDVDMSKFQNQFNTLIDKKLKEFKRTSVGQFNHSKNEVDEIDDCLSESYASELEDSYNVNNLKEESRFDKQKHNNNKINDPDKNNVKNAYEKNQSNLNKDELSIENEIIESSNNENNEMNDLKNVEIKRRNSSEYREKIVKDNTLNKLLSKDSINHSNNEENINSVVNLPQPHPQNINISNQKLDIRNNMPQPAEFNGFEISQTTNYTVRPVMYGSNQNVSNISGSNVSNIPAPAHYTYHSNMGSNTQSRHSPVHMNNMTINSNNTMPINTVYGQKNYLPSKKLVRVNHQVHQLISY
jgi:hypothetical protein